MKYKKTIITVIAVLVVIILGVTAKQLFFGSSQPNDQSSSATSSTSSSLVSSSSSSSQVSSSSSSSVEKSHPKKIKKSKVSLTTRGIFKPITKDFYGNWYFGKQVRIVVQDYLFRGDHPTDPVSGPGPLVMQRYGHTNAVYINSLYAINTYWPATLKIDGDKSYSVMVTSNAPKFTDFKIYTSVPTDQPIKEFIYHHKHAELVDNHNLSMEQLNNLK